MSELSETEQASIVFLGRDSFRMQIVGAEATPSPTWESKTQRIIERRKNDRERRAGDRRQSTPTLADWPELPAKAPLRRTIIMISFVTFVSGAAVATAMDQLRRRVVMPAQVARTERVQPVTPPPAPPVLPAVAAQPSAPPPSAPVVEPLPEPDPEFLVARTAPETAPPASEAQPETLPIVAKATPIPRGALTPALRPRRAASARTTPGSTTAPRALNVDPFDEPPAKAPARASSRWVDPFAE